MWAEWLLPESRRLYNKENGFYNICCIPRWVIVWGAPCLLAGFGFFLQNLQLHATTYFYVHSMMQVDLQRAPAGNRSGFAGEEIPLSIGETPGDVSFGSVHDPISEMLGHGAANIQFLDFLALLIPAIFVFTSVLLDNAYTFARAMFCFFFMEVLKGLTDWITVVPDSNGWKVCQERLGQATNGYDIAWYAQERSFWELLQAEVHAPTGRFCADMMLSGHTQVVTIFGLGLFETVSLMTNVFGGACGNKWCEGRLWRVLIQTAVAVLVIGQQSLEIYFVIKSRFHYSSDMLLALIVSYLLYTGTCMAWLAYKWIMQGKRLDDDLWDRRVEELQKMPNTQNFCCCYEADLTKYKKPAPLKNRWLRVFVSTPEMIQLGCCCHPMSQQYILDHEDYMELLDTVDKSNRAWKKALVERKAPEDEEVKKIEEEYGMNKEVREQLLLMLGFPPEVAQALEAKAEGGSADGADTPLVGGEGAPQRRRAGGSDRPDPDV